MSKEQRVLVLQHEPGDPPGALGEIMSGHGLAWDVVLVEEQPLPDDVRAYDALIAMGGPQHVGDDERYPYFVPEYALIQQAMQHDLPYLGICLGGQLLAHALGGRVTRHEQTELGFVQVDFTEAGRADPLYQGLPGHQRVFQWHEDTFALPPGAVRLATNAHTQNQAFRVGRRAYALQYHIELTPDLFRQWVALWEKEMQAVLGPQGAAHLLASAEDVLPTYQAHARQLFENFLRIGGLL